MEIGVPIYDILKSFNRKYRYWPYQCNNIFQIICLLILLSHIYLKSHFVYSYTCFLLAVHQFTCIIQSRVHHISNCLIEIWDVATY